jgi:hypothetical protein
MVNIAARVHLLRDVAIRTGSVVLRSLFLGGILCAVSLTFMWSSKKWLGWKPTGPIATLFFESKQEAQALLYVYDNQTGWKPNPYTQLRSVARGPFSTQEPRDILLRTNSEGFFDREHYLKSPYYRIAFLGDSWVEAQSVDYSMRFTELIETYVHSKSQGQKGVEVMNFGVSNLGTAQEYGVLKHHALKYHPDAIWILFNPNNDISDSSPMWTAPPLGPTYSYKTGQNGDELEDIRFGFPDPPAIAHERIRQRYGVWMQKPQQAVLPYLFSNKSDPVFDAVWSDVRQSMRAIKRLADSISAELVIVYLPHSAERNMKSWDDFLKTSEKATHTTLELTQTRAEQRIKALASENGANFLSLKPLIAEHGTEEMIGDHFSRMGHHWVADFISQYLMKSACCALPTSSPSP